MSDQKTLTSRVNQHDKELAEVKKDVHYMSEYLQSLSSKIDKNHTEVRDSIHDFRDIVAHASTVQELSEKVERHDDELKSIKQSRKFFSENWFNLIKVSAWVLAAVFSVVVWKQIQDKEAQESINADKIHSEQIQQLTNDIKTLILSQKKFRN